mgnify:CR=1 FL=1
MTPYYEYREWIDDPTNCVYLGTETNRKTGLVYDFYIIRTGHTGHNEHDWSPTCRHGMRPEDYGSAPLCVSHYNFCLRGNDLAGDFNDLAGDFVYGLIRAQQLSLYYLATNKKPLLEED